MFHDAALLTQKFLTGSSMIGTTRRRSSGQHRLRGLHETAGHETTGKTWMYRFSRLFMRPASVLCWPSLHEVLCGRVLVLRRASTPRFFVPGSDGSCDRTIKVSVL